MKKTIILLASLCASLTTLAQYKYPATAITDSSNTYFGVTYHDQYRWLEHIKSPEVVDWFKQQSDLANGVINKINGKDELVQEWLTLDKLQPATIRNLDVENGRYFYNKHTPGDKVAKYYYRQGFKGKEILLFDPLTYIPGKVLSMRSALPSFDGKKVAIAYAVAGSEISTIKILNVDTKIFLPETIYPSWDGAGSWTFDDKAFTYSWFRSGDNTSQDMEINGKTKLHVVGTPASTDVDFFSNESYPNLSIAANNFPTASLNKDCRKYIFGKVTGVQDSRDYNEYYAPISQLNSQKKDWKVLCTKADQLVGSFEFVGDMVYAMSVKNANNGKLLVTNMAHPDWSKATVVAKERKDLKLTNIAGCKDYMLLTYNDGINDHLFKYNFITKKTAGVKLPFAGSCYVFCLDKKTNNFFFEMSSWVKDNNEFVYNAASNKLSPGAFNLPPHYPAAYNELQTEEVEVKGHDGVMIPLSLIYKKGLKRDGSNTCLMEGYGAYGTSITSGMDIKENTLAIKGVVVAIVHPRGGGEKGEAWYKGGFKTTKPNTWKDFNSCAEYLIANKYTSASHLSGIGTSAGGVLIGRAITERPDLYAAAICNVGIANPMRFETTPNGPMNVNEFGTVKDSVESRALYEMDGVMHVVKGTQYPAVVCVAGWNDPRVIPWQPGKFAGSLQNASTSGKPVLMKVNYDSGHFTEDRSVTYRNFAEMYAFVLWQCGHPDFQLKQ